MVGVGAAVIHCDDQLVALPVIADPAKIVRMDGEREKCRRCDRRYAPKYRMPSSVHRLSVVHARRKLLGCADLPKSPFAFRVFIEGLCKSGLIEVRPECIDEAQLGIGAFPK